MGMGGRTGRICLHTEEEGGGGGAGTKGVPIFEWVVKSLCDGQAPPRIDLATLLPNTRTGTVGGPETEQEQEQVNGRASERESLGVFPSRWHLLQQSKMPGASLGAPVGDRAVLAVFDT